MPETEKTANWKKRQKLPVHSQLSALKGRNGAGVYSPCKKTVKISSTVTYIKSTAFQNSRAKKVIFTKNIQKIGAAALNGKKIQTITVPKDNPYYAKAGNCIYDKRTHHLAVGICRNGTLKLNKKIRCLKRNASMAGTSVRTLVIPKQMKQFYKDWSDCMRLDWECCIYFISKKTPKAGKEYQYFADSRNYYVPENSWKRYLDWYQAAGASIHLWDYQKLPF